MTAKDSARRIARTSDRDMMIIVAGGYGKARQDELVADIRALVVEAIGAREAAHAHVYTPFDDPSPSGPTAA